ncbi:MAG: ribonuclease Y, partial [Candidatus Dormibacteraceae bacterium]
MPTFVIDALVAIVAILIGALIGYVIARRAIRQRQDLQLAEAEARMGQRIAEVESETKEKLLEAKEEAVKIRTAAETEAREARAQSQHAEQRLHNREEHLERRAEELGERERELVSRERSVDELRAQEQEAQKAQLRELERVANMTRQEAQGIVMGQVEQDLRNEVARKVREAELQARDEGEKRARAIVTEAIQRVAADQTAETSVSVLPLPNEEIKGRIIGREGRNIRALQQATGIDLIVDDTPEAVVISGFDPIRREVARVALNKLIVDGRIHPARIEETVQKARDEVDHRVKEEGEAAVLELGLQGLHPEVVRHLGMLRFRTSYGQQVLNHSKEVAYLAGMMAAEIGADVRMARLAGLLHDIGKSIDHQVEGSHAVIGADLIQRHGVPQPVVHAVRAHH